MAGRETGGNNGEDFQIGVSSEIGKNVAAGDVGAESSKDEAVDFKAIDAKMEADQKRIEERGIRLAKITQERVKRETSERVVEAKQIESIRADLGLPPEPSGDDVIHEIGVDSIAGEKPAETAKTVSPKTETTGFAAPQAEASGERVNTLADSMEAGRKTTRDKSAEVGKQKEKIADDVDAFLAKRGKVDSNPPPA